MAAERPQRRRIRLERAAYAEPGAVFSVTVCVRGREPVFAADAVARAAATVLEELALRLDVPVYAWCIMPDHIHLVVGPSAQCDVVTFVGRFKNLALRAAWQAGADGAFWQASFWDHAVRRDGQFREVIAYVLGNPVRAGLAVDPAEYPHCGVDLGAAGDKPPPYTE